jgi:hypothetical protein
MVYLLLYFNDPMGFFDLALHQERHASANRLPCSPQIGATPLQSFADADTTPGGEWADRFFFLARFGRFHGGAERRASRFTLG